MSLDQWHPELASVLDYGGSCRMKSSPVEDWETERDDHANRSSLLGRRKADARPRLLRLLLAWTTTSLVASKLPFSNYLSLV
jgi:hypothetical protein